MCHLPPRRPDSMSWSSACQTGSEDQAVGLPRIDPALLSKRTPLIVPHRPSTVSPVERWTLSQVFPDPPDHPPNKA